MKINSIATSSLVVLSLLFTAAGAYAQSPVQAHVPFAFKVGTTQMPSGTYVIDREFGSNFVTVRNVKTGQSVHAMGRREETSKKADKLIFHDYQNHYFLTEIWGSVGSQGTVLPSSKPERQLQVASGSANAATNVEIASK